MLLHICSRLQASAAADVFFLSRTVSLLMAFEPLGVAFTWTAHLASALQSGNDETAGGLFLSDGWLRDLLVFGWDIRALEGRDRIHSYLHDTLQHAQITHTTLSDDPHLTAQTSYIPQMHTIDVELAFTFECRKGHGRGYARLLPDQDGTFKAFSVMMMLDDIRGHEELKTLPLRDELTGVPGRSMQNEYAAWVEKVETKPYVVIGQTGLQIAARMKAMQVPALVVERCARIGDHWRRRYPTLTLHTIKRHHSLLYQSYPTNWPEYTPKDKLADWLEHYASIQDLVVWTASELQPRPVYNMASGRWEIIVRRGEKEVQLSPAHLILATGTLGEAHMPDCPGRDAFQGEVLHSEGFHGGERFTGKRVIVVGAGNTSIDICQDLVFNEAQSVTMIQRSSTCVMSRDLLSSFQRHTWTDDRPLDISDFLAASWPIGLQKKLAIASQDAMWHMDKELHAKLRNGGLQLNMGPEGEGFYLLTLERFGGQDKGGADLIANGSIKVRSGIAPERFTETGLVFNDGMELSADVVIFATGYLPITESNRRLLGNEVIAQAGDVYGLDAEGELQGSYRPTGHPGLWYGTGDFFVSRFYSKLLALQIKARQLQMIRNVAMGP
ncbi:hypothetical protein BN946_scf184908.g84 [Trametes cinnabarina]|uniref:FAD/NAD(P)-binding domain-containing protein n=1 Tax=Pycnoporus cinnabarinus TaxID=5643 RepID=A0A060SAV4_PYCCI|nr:hypothetical protein BN946_scf184908.g84 [Trametes cinnabarina]